jgi:hypothetical protein
MVGSKKVERTVAVITILKVFEKNELRHLHYIYLVFKQ